jgi:hypothetical protein
MPVFALQSRNRSCRSSVTRTISAAIFSCCSFWAARSPCVHVAVDIAAAPAAVREPGHGEHLRALLDVDGPLRQDDGLGHAQAMMFISFLGGYVQKPKVESPPASGADNQRRAPRTTQFPGVTQIVPEGSCPIQVAFLREDYL